MYTTDDATSTTQRDLTIFHLIFLECVLTMALLVHDLLAGHYEHCGTISWEQLGKMHFSYQPGCKMSVTPI